jgi:hypothetical protein
LLSYLPASASSWGWRMWGRPVVCGLQSYYRWRKGTGLTSLLQTYWTSSSSIYCDLFPLFFSSRYCTVHQMFWYKEKIAMLLDLIDICFFNLLTVGVGLGWVVREVRLSEDCRYESQLWQWINFSFWFAIDCER